MLTIAHQAHREQITLRDILNGIIGLAAVDFTYDLDILHIPGTELFIRHNTAHRIDILPDQAPVSQPLDILIHGIQRFMPDLFLYIPIRGRIAGFLLNLLDILQHFLQPCFINGLQNAAPPFK